MSDYGSISPNFWTGETGRQIKSKGVEAQLVGTYLMTNSHRNALGLYYIPMVLISHETALSEEGALKGLQSLIEVGWCSYDRGSEVVWIHEMARYQIADELKEKDNRVKWINQKYQAIPKNPFLKLFFDKYAAAFHIRKERGFEAPSKPDSDSDSDTDKKRTGSGEPVVLHFSKTVSPKNLDCLLETAKRVSVLPISKKTKFNVWQWIQTQANRKKHPQAILDCLQSVEQHGSGIRGTVWQYLNNVIKSRSQNYNEADYVRQAEEFKEQLSNAGGDIRRLAEMASKTCKAM